MKESTPSPYFPRDEKKSVLSDENMKKIQDILGCEAVLVFASDKINCSEEICTGHFVQARAVGFGDQQVNGILEVTGSQHIHSGDCGHPYTQ